MKVELYKRPHTGASHGVEMLLNLKGIEYTPYLISENEEKLAKHGIDTNTTDSPIIIFDNGEYETITTGFNETALIDLIKEIETNTPKENEGA